MQFGEKGGTIRASVERTGTGQAEWEAYHTGSILVLLRVHACVLRRVQCVCVGGCVRETEQCGVRKTDARRKHGGRMGGWVQQMTRSGGSNARKGGLIRGR